MNLKIEHIVILCLIGYIIFLQQCTKPKVEWLKDSATHTTEYQVTTVKIDTIPFKYPVPYLVEIPITPPTSTEIDSADGSVINNYTLSVEDSLIKGTLFSKVDGTLIDQKFEYVPKFPQYIKETITKDVYRKRKNLLFLTAGLEGNNTFFSTFSAHLLT